jgi:hypothetical protein
LLLSFQVILEHVFNKATIVSMVSANLAAKSFGSSLKVMFCCQCLLRIRGGLQIDMPKIGVSIHKDCRAIVMILAQLTFGLWNESRLTAFQLVDVHSATCELIQLTPDCLSTLVFLPDAPMPMMQLMHFGAMALQAEELSEMCF